MTPIGSALNSSVSHLSKLSQEDSSRILQEVVPLYGCLQQRLEKTIQNHYDVTHEHFPLTFIVLNCDRPKKFDQLRQAICSLQIYQRSLCINPVFNINSFDLTRSMNATISKEINTTKTSLHSCMRKLVKEGVRLKYAQRQEINKELHQKYTQDTWQHMCDRIREKDWVMGSASIPTVPLFRNTILWTIIGCFGHGRSQGTGVERTGADQTVLGRLYQPRV